MDILAYITANLDAIIAVFLAAHGLALAIVNLTPTPVDDAFVGKVYRIVEVLAGVFTATAKEFPGERADIKAAVAEYVS